MAKVKRLITKKQRYLTLEEAQALYELLSETNGTYKLKEITKNAYAIEVIELEEVEKSELKEQLREMLIEIYKTKEAWKNLIDRQKERELLKESM